MELQKTVNLSRWNFHTILFSLKRFWRALKDDLYLTKYISSCMVLMFISCPCISFLACLLARKNRHVVFQTLKVSKTLLKKHHQFFFGTFAKEGVKHAIDAIQAREKHTNYSNHKSKRKNSMQESCLCFDLDLETSSTDEECRIENNAILKLAEETKKS